MTRHMVRELEDLSSHHDASFLDDLAFVLDDAARSIRPAYPLYTRSSQGRMSVQNLIGTLALPNGDLVEVLPKTGSDRWADAVVSLINPKTRFHVTFGAGGTYSMRTDLIDAVATEYGRRLSDAVRRSGPMLSYERLSMESPRLSGRLLTGKWLVRRLTNPSVFPVGIEKLIDDNGFSRTMSAVARLLAGSAKDGETSSLLLRLCRDLRPGRPLYCEPDPGTLSVEFPRHWNDYVPAWDIAASVLQGMFHAGDGHGVGGMELSVEPWRLLERLLKLCLDRIAADGEIADDYSVQEEITIIGDPEMKKKVRPDGLLYDQDRVVANIDAKYKPRSRILDSRDLYQVMVAASVFDSPVSLLVYPGDFPAQCFKLMKGTTPLVVGCVGLDLFSYSSRSGIEPHASRIVDAIRKCRAVIGV